jgi:hypothetical protein
LETHDVTRHVTVGEACEGSPGIINLLLFVCMALTVKLVCLIPSRTIFGKSRRRKFEQKLTIMNNYRQIFSFKDTYIQFESIFKQNCEDYQVTSIIAAGSMNLSSIPFPWKLHEMLDHAKKDEGFQSIISWLPDHENAFRVHNSAAFLDLVMPEYFKQTKYRSFQRQINIWGFCHIPSGQDKGGYVHPCLIRGKPSLCLQMAQRKIKKEGGLFSTSRKTASVATLSLSSSLSSKTCASRPCLMYK